MRVKSKEMTNAKFMIESLQSQVKTERHDRVQASTQIKVEWCVRKYSGYYKNIGKKGLMDNQNEGYA